MNTAPKQAFSVDNDPFGYEHDEDITTALRELSTTNSNHNPESPTCCVYHHCVCDADNPLLEGLFFVFVVLVIVGIYILVGTMDAPGGIF